jgi:hypothetical protein
VWPDTVRRFRQIDLRRVINRLLAPRSIGCGFCRAVQAISRQGSLGRERSEAKGHGDANQKRFEHRRLHHALRRRSAPDGRLQARRALADRWEAVRFLRFWHLYREARLVGYTRFSAFRAALARR